MKQFVSILLIGFLTITAVMGEKAFNAINLDARKSTREGPELRTAQPGELCDEDNNCIPGYCCFDDGTGPECVSKEGNNECKNRCTPSDPDCIFHADGHPGVPGCCRRRDGHTLGHCQKQHATTCGEQIEQCEGECDCSSCTISGNPGVCCGDECVLAGDVNCETCPGCRQCQCFTDATCRQRCFKSGDTQDPTGCCNGVNCVTCPDPCCPENEACVNEGNPGICDEDGDCVTECNGGNCNTVININTCGGGSGNGGGGGNCGGNSGGGESK